METAGFDPERRSMAALTSDGELVCLGRVSVPRAIRDVDRVGLEGTVHQACLQHWGSVERDATIWAQWYTGARAFRPELSFVVLDGVEVAAYLLSYYWAADAEATGVREAWVGQLGTRAPWRGRGLGSALLGTA